MSLNDINSLSHSKWNCKYHVVFAPKYRRMVFYGEKKVIVGKILRQLCEWKGVKIIQAELCPDHVHMLLEIPPKIAVSSFMGYLKGKSTTMIYEQFPELKYKYRNREFWCKGYYVDTAGKNKHIVVSNDEDRREYFLAFGSRPRVTEGQVVKKVTLKGNNGEQVAGEIYVNTADATSILAAEMGFSSDHTQVGGTMIEDDTILTEVTLNCGEGVALGSESTAFYIALPPQEFSKGLTLKVLYADGTTMTKSTSNSIEIARNTILPMSTLYYDGNVPPVYELAYTTNDGEPLDPLTTEGFGANFVENIFGCKAKLLIKHFEWS